MPKALADRPEPPRQPVDFFWDAWRRLHAARSMGFNSPDPIAMEAIAAFCEIAGLEVETAMSVMRIVQRLDAVYLGWWFDQKGSPPKTDAAGEGVSIG
jgi:hypothetical protein